MITPADIITRFGGASALARVVNLVDVSLRPGGRTVTPEMVCNWRVRGRINQDWYPAILDAAKEAEIGLSADDLIALNICQTNEAGQEAIA